MPTVIICGSYGEEYQVPEAEVSTWIANYIRQCAPEELLPFRRMNPTRQDVRAAVEAECERYNRNARAARERAVP